MIRKREMKQIIEVIEDIGEELVDISLSNLLTQKICYESIIQDSSHRKVYRDNQGYLRCFFQNKITDMMIQSVEDFYNLLDKEDKGKFIEMIRDRKLKPLSRDSMQGLATYLPSANDYR